MEYSKDINSLLGDPKSLPTPVIEDPKAVMQVNLLGVMLFLCYLLLLEYVLKGLASTLANVHINLNISHVRLLSQCEFASCL